jgi:hypothetical protein
MNIKMKIVRESILESADPFLKIYKKFDDDFYNYVVFKGRDFFEMRFGKPGNTQWKYLGQTDPKNYSIRGTLVKNPPMKIIYTVQNLLKKP